MKRYYAFFAAALINVCAFASKDVVPSDAVLSDYYDQGDVCVCIFVPADMACNDFVFTGSFNSWSSKVEKCAMFKAVEGYDGWYVTSFEPEAEPDAEKGIQGKPIMLYVDGNGNGNFVWDYQIGAATVIRGGVQVVQGAYAGEIDLINYGADAPNVLTVDAWKQNPCTAIYHNYIIIVINDGCDGLAVPYVVGGMNNWKFTQMEKDAGRTLENEAPTYIYTFRCAESSPFQIVSGLMDEYGEIISAPNWNDDNYLQQKSESGIWSRIPGEDGDNLLTHEDIVIVFDLRRADLRWARCAEEEIAVVEDSYSFIYRSKDAQELFSANVSLSVPVAPEIEGFTFIGWQASGMLDEGIELQAVYEANTPTSAPMVVNPANKAQKLIRNGNVYILTDKKTYTIQGQVK